MPEKKELHFFDNERLFREESVDYSLFHTPFEPADEHNVRRLLFPLKPRLARCSKYVHCCLADGLGAALRVHD